MSHWALLGIPPTQDKSTIRRAYARRLKALRLEQEAAAFQSLRDARERALLEADASDVVPTILYVQPHDVESNEFLTKADPSIEGGQRLRVVETDLLDDEQQHEPLLLDGGRISADKLAHLEARLTACLAPLAKPKEPVDMAALDAILGRIADLPVGSGRSAERFCLRQLVGRLKRPDGTFDSARALRVRPILLACAAAFGWSFTDDLILDTLEARDADTVFLMLDARDGEPSFMKRPPAARLRRFDAQVLLEGSPRLFSLYKAVVAGGSLPWHFEPWCVPAPFLWAFWRRYWALSLAWYLVAAGAAAIAVVPNAPPRAVVTASVLLTITICFAGGFLADRMVFLQAWMTARKADRRGLFDAVDRRSFLRKQNTKLNGGLLFYFVLMAFWVSLFPYFEVLRFFGVVFWH